MNTSSACRAFFVMLVVLALGCLRIGRTGSGSSNESNLCFVLYSQRQEHVVNEHLSTVCLKQVCLIPCSNKTTSFRLVFGRQVSVFTIVIDEAIKGASRRG